MRTTVEATQRNDERIVAAAIKVFSEKGYTATSVQDIAQEAQISRGPLYYRYKTKKELFIAALEVYTKQEMCKFAHLFQQKKPFYEKIRDYLYYGTRYIRGEASTFPVEIFPEPDMQDVNEKIREIYAQVHLLTKRAVVQAVQNGEVRPDTDADQLVNLLFIAFDGLQYSRMKTGVISSPDKVEEAIDCMCNLLKTGYCME